MDFKSKKTSLIILGLTAIVCSEAFFWFLDDPEGTNLLIVTVLALIICGLSLIVCSFNPLIKGLKRLLFVILIQIIIVGGLCLFLK
jgi:hypothetical protein